MREKGEQQAGVECWASCRCVSDLCAVVAAVIGLPVQGIVMQAVGVGTL